MVLRGLYVDLCPVREVQFLGKQKATTLLVGIDRAVDMVNVELKGATLRVLKALCSAVLRSATPGINPRDYASPEIIVCPCIRFPIDTIGGVERIDAGLFALEAVRDDCGAAAGSARGAQSGGRVVEHIAFHAVAGAGQTYGSSPST